MFFDRDQSYQRSKELAYRNQLKSQIQMKNSMLNKNSRIQPAFNTNSKQQKFSLIANIEIAAEQRKNKQNEYYAELRHQIQKQKQQKKRMKQQQARKQRQQQQKIRRDNEILKQRYEEEKKKQNIKKGQVQNNTNLNENNNIITKQTKRNQLKESDFQLKQTSVIKNNNLKLIQNRQQPRINTSESHTEENTLNMQASGSYDAFNIKKNTVPYIHTYTNKIQNESYNYLPQRRYMNSYFSELLGERRMLEQEASGMAELNKMFLQEKVRASRIESRGLQELRNLKLFLEQKGTDYMQSISNRNIVDSSRFKSSGLKF